MQKTSRDIEKSGFFAPIALPKDFPVSQPSFETPPTQAHLHDCFEIGLCRSGSGVFIIADKIFSCASGDAVFINNKEFHVLRDASPLNSDWRFVNFSPLSLFKGWSSEEAPELDTSRLSGKSFINVIRERNRPDILFMVRKVMEELEKQAPSHQDMVRSLIWGLLIQLHRLAPRNDVETAGESERFRRIYPALQYISEHYAENIDIPQLAKRCHCSVSTFRRIFQENLNCLPIKYINHFRLKVAATQLSTTKVAILDIALDSGFPTLSNFNRQFKAVYDQSPREYRQRSKS